MTQALKELAEKVELGQFRSHFEGPEHTVWPGIEHQNSLKRHHLRYAYNGSLDAAKDLHDALLPGWKVTTIIDARSHVCVESVSHTGCALSDNPARAWLLAILRALIAQEGE